jgi:hypothetical protein
VHSSDNDLEISWKAIQKTLRAKLMQAQHQGLFILLEFAFEVFA